MPKFPSLVSYLLFSLSFTSFDWLLLLFNLSLHFEFFLFNLKKDFRSKRRYRACCTTLAVYHIDSISYLHLRNILIYSFPLLLLLWLVFAWALSVGVLCYVMFLVKRFFANQFINDIFKQNLQHLFWI